MKNQNKTNCIQDKRIKAQSKQSKNSKQPGFSLIEVLIAIVVFSFGLLGIAGLMTVSIRSNHNGYLRSQAIISVSNMASKMRANVGGLWKGKYNGAAPTNAENACTKAAPCNREALALYDMSEWGKSLNQLLPNGRGNIRCPVIAPPAGILSSGEWIASPPFTEVCEIAVRWTESNESGVEAQIVKLVIQP